MTVHKLRKTHFEQQLEDIEAFGKDDPTFNLIAIMVFTDEEGERQIGFSLPEGLDYLALLGSLSVAQDWVLAEMADGGDTLH